MACQTPAVIATDIPGTRELVRDGQTGWLVQPGSVERKISEEKRAFSQREAQGASKRGALHVLKQNLQ